MQNISVGLAVVTAGTAVAAVVGWRDAIDSYSGLMSDRARLPMTFGVPSAILLSAAPVLDVALWLFAGYPFPTVGVAAPVVGLVGGVAVVTYVTLDPRRTTSLDAGAAASG